MRVKIREPVFLVFDCWSWENCYTNDQWGLGLDAINEIRFLSDHAQNDVEDKVLSPIEALPRYREIWGSIDTRLGRAWLRSNLERKSLTL